MRDDVAAASSSAPRPTPQIYSSTSTLPLASLTWPTPNPSTDDALVPPGDIAIEQDLLLNPHSLRTWMSYISHIESTNYHPRSPPDNQFTPTEAVLLGPLASGQNRLALRRIVSAYERALALFPTSYTLHRNYLLARSRFVLGEPKGGWEALTRGGSALVEEDLWQARGALDGTVGYQEWISLVAACERSLQWLPRMPRLHLFYLSIFTHPLCPATLRLTHARRTFDRSLRTLPPSLHPRIWPVYLLWAEGVGGETAVRVWRRYLSVDINLTERYVKLLLTEPTPARILEAAKLLLSLATRASRGEYTFYDGKAPNQLFLQWMDLVEEYPGEVGLDEDEERSFDGQTIKFPREQDTCPSSPARLPVSNIVLSALPSYPDCNGRLWTRLATYHLRRGELDAAKRIFAQGLASVVTVRDFSVIFDAFAESQEGIVSHLMNELENGDGGQEEADELDAHIHALESLIESRPHLLNDVMLRRNPDDVQEWEKRVALYKDHDDAIVETYKRAIDKINPRRATANLHVLYLSFARFHEVGGSAGLKHVEGAEPLPDSDDELPIPDLPSARAILEKATTVPFKRVDDLAEVWIAWAEMEIRHGRYDDALRLLARATASPSAHVKLAKVSYHDESLSPQLRLFKSLKLWSFYSDLQESIGNIEGTQQVYDRILELKIADAQTMFNYASFLEERGYHENAFSVYERGMEAFSYPVAFELWNVYLSKFIHQYKGSKVERTRDLFEQAIAACGGTPSVKVLYIKYGAFEEEWELATRALTIYQRAVQGVPERDCLEMHTFLIAKTASSFGLAATRPLYESAIQSLPDRAAATMSLRFASLERKLGEIDRARAIYKYASQLCDPRVHVNFWREWNSFEIDTGNEDTFRDMLRVKRSVRALFNTDLSYLKANAAGGVAATAANSEDAMARLDAQQQSAALPGASSKGMFVSAKTAAGMSDADAERVGGVDDEDDDLM